MLAERHHGVQNDVPEPAVSCVCCCPSVDGLCLLFECLCTTGFAVHPVNSVFVDPFSLARKCLFFWFFILCMKSEQCRIRAETAVKIGSMNISSTELSTGCVALRTFRQQKNVARCERGFAEGAEANGVILLL
ncbi:hypothetical protein D3C75_1116720 [compost metagenome]